MKSILYVALPGVLAQTLGSSVTTLYNGGNLLYSNCGAKTSACDCHYASCSLSGDCACGWDDTTLTCRAGVTTKCVSCPAMRRCSVSEKLIIGPNGFPVPGQLSVWSGTRYPDNSGVIGQTSGSSSQGQSSQAGQTYVYQQNQGQPTTQYFGQPQSTSSQGTQQVYGQVYSQPQTQFTGTQQVYGQPQTQSTSNQQVYSQPQTQSTYSQGQTALSAQYFGQPQSTSSQGTQQVYGQAYSQPQAQSTSNQQVYGQPQTQSASTQQPYGQPLSLYQDNALSAGGCAAKASACDCHYASCTPNGDCLCGWDASSLTCRAGIPTQCASCPSMSRCGVREGLLIGPDGFPVPGQLSVWGSVPYPDQSNQANFTSTYQNQANTYQTQSNAYQTQANTYQTQGNAQANTYQTQPNTQANTYQSNTYQSNNVPLNSYQNAYTVQALSQPIQLSSTTTTTSTTTTAGKRGKAGKAARNQTIYG